MQAAALALEDVLMATQRTSKFIGCSAIIFVVLGGVFYFLWSQLFIHDWFLSRFAHSYAAISHPPDTRHIRTYKDVGLLIGNGNHIDLFVGELRSYRGTRSKIVSWYASQGVPSQLEHGESREAVVVFIDHGRVSPGKIGFDHPSSLETILRDVNALKTPVERYYVVYILDAGYPPGIDIGRISHH